MDVGKYTVRHVRPIDVASKHPEDLAITPPMDQKVESSCT